MGVSLLCSRSFPVVSRSVPSLPALRRPGALIVRGRFAYAGGGIVDFGTTNLPTPPRLRWYGLVPVGLPTRVLEIYPSPVSLVPLPGTTCTTVGGMVSLLDEDFSDVEDSPPLLASLGVPVPLHTL